MPEGPSAPDPLGSLPPDIAAILRNATLSESDRTLAEHRLGLGAKPGADATRTPSQSPVKRKGQLPLKVAYWSDRDQGQTRTQISSKAEDDFRGAIAALADIAPPTARAQESVSVGRNLAADSMPLPQLELNTELLIAAVNEQLLECERSICSLTVKTEVKVKGQHGSLVFTARKERWGLYFVPENTNEYRDPSQMSLEQRAESLALVPAIIEELRSKRLERHRKLVAAIEVGNEALKAVKAAIKGGL